MIYIARKTEYEFTHVHLVSSNPLKAAEFYEKAFGAKRESTREMPGGGISVNLSLGETPIRIKPDIGQTIDDNPRKRRGLEHFGIRTDDIDAAVSNLKKMGIQFLQMDPVSPTAKSVFLMGPDNVMIEVSPVNP